MRQIGLSKHSIVARCRRDLKNLADVYPEQLLQNLLRKWLTDPEWCRYYARLSACDRSKSLSELGLYAAQCDAGGYRTYIQNVTNSIREYLPNEPIDSLPTRHIEHLFVSLGDNVTFANNPLLSSELDRVEIQGMEHLENAMRMHRGVMVLSATQSHPAFAFKHPKFSKIGVSTVGNLGPDGAERNSPFFKGLEDRVEILPASIAAVRRMIHRLRSNGVVAVYGDFRFSDSGAAVGLQLGRPVLFARSAAGIALKHGTPVIPTTVARQWPLGSGPVEVRLFPAIPMHDLNRCDKDQIDRFSLRMSVAVDGLIRRYPAHWRLWNLLVPRWKEALEIAKEDTLVALPTPGENPAHEGNNF